MYEYLTSKVHTKVGNLYNPWIFKNFIFIINVQYDTRTKEVNKSKVVVKTDPFHYLLLKTYVVKRVQHKLKLIYTIQESDNVEKYYVADSELYDILHKIYTSFGYGGRNCRIGKKITMDKIIQYIVIYELVQSRKVYEKDLPSSLNLILIVE